MLVNRICKQCNERRIGLLDEQFVRCGPTAVLRKRFDIQGRQHHDKVNPFYRGSAGGQRVKFMSWDESFQRDVLIELTGGNQARQLTQLNIKGQSGPYHYLPLTAAMTPKMVAEQIANLELVGPLEVHLISDRITEPWATDLFMSLWPDAQLPEGKLGATGFKGGLVEFGTTGRYLRAIAKIGFHYFLTQFPEYSGHEPIFADVRDFIVNDVEELPPSRIDHFLGVHLLPITPPFAPLSDKVSHFLCAEIREGTCIVHFQLFATSAGRIPAFMIRLAFDPTRGSFALRAHEYRYYAQGKIGRYSGDALRADQNQIWIQGLHYRFLTTASDETQPGI